MTALPRIYLDNAATSWPKPEAVYAAVDRYQRELGAPAGRSAYAEATDVSRQVEAARHVVARLLGGVEPRRIIFTANGTDALNLAIHGALGEGDHVVTSVVEHNSVLRPLRELEDAGRIEVSRVRCDARGVIDPGDVRTALRPHTRLAVFSHASNVTGALQPVEEIAALVRAAGVLFLIDAAQSLGHLPWDVARSQADLVAAPGHKGLLGPLGTGLLYVAPDVEDRVRSLRQGGTGSRSEEDRQPRFLPDKFESGSLNVPGIVGLAAGADFLLARTLEEIRRHDAVLTARLLAGLSRISGATVLGPAQAEHRVGVVSITLDGYDPQEVAAMLDAARRIQVRSGIHCAPLMHAALGTLVQGGTVRFSLGPFNTENEIDAAIEAIGELSAAQLPAAGRADR